MTDKKKMQDKCIWERMGRELAALRDLIIKISVDSDYQDVMDRKTWDKLCRALDWVDKVRSDAEDRMVRFIPDWETTIFYPRDREDLNAAIKEFRSKLKEDHT